MTETINFEKMGGLVPAVVQDVDDGTVLMVGFMNKEAFERTLAEHEVVFWSRSKSRLWKKGETSGNSLRVVSNDVDCDGDALLIRALRQGAGVVCHKGTKSCFGEGPKPYSGNVLTELFSIIRERKSTPPENSYTARLFKEGTARIGQKVGEEAVELAIASQHTDTNRIVEETADLLYHILVLLADKGIDLAEVYGELARRRTKTEK